MSEKNFNNDYSFSQKEHLNINMVLSGKYLAKRKIEIDVNNAKIDEYPNDSRNDYLKSLIVKMHKNKSSKNFILGAGANGVIQNLIKILFSKGGTLITTEFSFSQPEYAVISLGGKVKHIKHNRDFTISFESILKEVDNKTKAIFLCNPNNPTGIYCDVKKIISFAKKVKIPVMVSEASIEFTKESSLLDFELPKNLIVIRSFSKTYGLAGLRIGYCYIQDKLLDKYIKYTTRYDVSILSVEIAIKILECFDINNNISIVINQRNYITKELNAVGINTIESNSNFIMSAELYASDFFDLLQNNGIAVVKIENSKKNYYYFRIAIQGINTNKKFISKIKYLFKNQNEIKKYKLH
jgi:histidinol-phosphate aminotransferase